MAAVYVELKLSAVDSNSRTPFVPHWEEILLQSLECITKKQQAALYPELGVKILEKNQLNVVMQNTVKVYLNIS